jgi:hypothetical protein
MFIFDLNFKSADIFYYIPRDFTHECLNFTLVIKTNFSILKNNMKNFNYYKIKKILRNKATKVENNSLIKKI